jgi:PDZ domain-containing secreted protein
MRTIPVIASATTSAMMHSATSENVRVWRCCAGVLVGDLVLEFDGQPVRSGDELLDLLHGDRVGKSVAVRLLRGTAVQSLAIVVGERPVG